MSVLRVLGLWAVVAILAALFLGRVSRLGEAPPTPDRIRQAGGA